MWVKIKDTLINTDTISLIQGRRVELTSGTTIIMNQPDVEELLKQLTPTEIVKPVIKKAKKWHLNTTS